MSGQHMPDILWMDECDTGSARTGKCHVGFSKPGVNYCHAYVRIDIAERMAEALERCAEARMPGEARRIAREALAAFKEATR